MASWDTGGGAGPGRVDAWNMDVKNFVNNFPERERKGKKRGKGIWEKRRRRERGERMGIEGKKSKV